MTPTPALRRPLNRQRHPLRAESPNRSPYCQLSRGVKPLLPFADLLRGLSRRSCSVYLSTALNRYVHLVPCSHWAPECKQRASQLSIASARSASYFLCHLPQTLPHVGCRGSKPSANHVVAEQLFIATIMSNEAYPSIEGTDLMVLETPLLRVSRPVAACSRCRAAKVKCDGKLPACTACEKSNRASECSSTNDQFARGKERSYVATLEARVERLEKKIAESRNRRKSSTILMLDTSEAPTPRRTSVDTVKAPKPISKRAARRKEASQIDELVSDFGLL